MTWVGWGDYSVWLWDASIEYRFFAEASQQLFYLAIVSWSHTAFKSHLHLVFYMTWFKCLSRYFLLRVPTSSAFSVSAFRIATIVVKSIFIIFPLIFFNPMLTCFSHHLSSLCLPSFYIPVTGPSSAYPIFACMWNLSSQATDSG